MTTNALAVALIGGWVICQTVWGGLPKKFGL